MLSIDESLNLTFVQVSHAVEQAVEGRSDPVHAAIVLSQAQTNLAIKVHKARGLSDKARYRGKERRAQMLATAVETLQKGQARLAALAKLLVMTRASHRPTSDNQRGHHREVANRV